MGSLLFSPSSLVSSSSSTTIINGATSSNTKSGLPSSLIVQTTSQHQTSNSNSNSNSNSKPSLLLSAIATAGALVLSTTGTVGPLPTLAASSYNIYYGTAASAANYGGYGGNSSKKDSAEYIYDVPQGWKERLVSKVEKGTNGTDSEFYNPKKKTEKEYLTFLAGFRQLAPKDVILNNLALSDVNLQDQIADAETVTSIERKDEQNGQLYYDYEIHAAASHSLISVTCANNKLFAHFVNAPTPDWNRDQDMLRHLHLSFKTTTLN